MATLDHQVWITAPGERGNPSAFTECENPGGFLGLDVSRPMATVLDFRRSGWIKEHPYFGFCNFAWGATLLGLKQWCEGKASRE